MKTGNYFLMVLLSVILVAAAFNLAGVPIEEPQVSTRESLFDEQSSFDYLEEFVTSYPNRDIYHPDGRKAAIWLQEQLASFGLPVYTQEFSQYVKDEVVTGQENVYAVSRGAVHPDEIILVVAHYDIPPFVYQGAMDNGSGVAVNLELARIFSQEPHNRTMVFLMSDSEEYGAMTGALRFMDEFEDMDRVKAVLVLDSVNPGETAAVRVFPMGLQSGFTPLWLRELCLGAVSHETEYDDPGPVMEWIYRTVAVSPTEAGVFLRDGFPAVYLGGISTDGELYNRIHHTEHDTIDKMQADSMGYFGRSTERIIRSLDELGEIPEECMFYLKTGDTYIPNWAVFMIQLLFLLPIGYALVAGYRLRVQSPGFGETFKRGFIRWFILFMSGTAGFAVLKLLPYTDLMVRYELYPATQLDPVLYNPQYLPALLVLAAMVLTGLVLRSLFKRYLVPLSEDWEGERLVLLIGLALLYLLTVAVGAGYTAVTFLLVPVYLWPLVGRGRSRGRIVLNLFLILAGFLIYLLFMYAFSNIFNIGVMWWYLLMASSYGMFSFRTVVAVLAGLSLYVIGAMLATDSKHQSDFSSETNVAGTDS